MLQQLTTGDNCSGVGWPNKQKWFVHLEPARYFCMNNWMNGVLGLCPVNTKHLYNIYTTSDQRRMRVCLCAHIGWIGPGDPPEDGEINEMTLPSRHRILNSSPDGLRPDMLTLGHGRLPTMLSQSPCVSLCEIRNSAPNVVDYLE